MVDTIEGSPKAARRAHGTEKGLSRNFVGIGGWMARLFGIGSVDSTTASESSNGAPGAGSVLKPRSQLTGMAIPQVAVEEVALTKADIVAVSITIGLSELVGVFRESGLSRLPVFKGSLDNPCGFVHLKDLALSHGFNGKRERFNLKDMLRPLLYVPPSMPTAVLFKRMQAERKHMALVIDEYGGVDGLVTIEDLFEQVFGDIEDEHDIVDDDDDWIEESPGVFLCKAKAPLTEFESMIGKSLIEEKDEEIDTLGGMVFLLVGRVPARGEVIPHPAGPEIEIVDADPRSIKRLRIRV